MDSFDELAIMANEQWADLRLYGSEIVEVTQNVCLQATLAEPRNRHPLTVVDVDS